MIQLNQQDNGVAVLSLNRPEVRNAINPELIADLSQQLTNLSKQPDLRLVVLKGEGKSFCAGADLTWFANQTKQPEAKVIAEAQQLSDLLAQFAGLSVPTLAVVHGHCYGGGLGLVACADIAIAADDTKLCFSEAKWGLAPATIAPYVINALGRRRAGYLFQTALPFSATQAEQWGLIHQVHPAEQLAVAEQVLIDQLLANAPHAQRLIKTDLCAAKATHQQLAELLATLLQHPDTIKLLESMQG